MGEGGREGESERRIESGRGGMYTHSYPFLEVLRILRLLTIFDHVSFQLLDLSTLHLESLNLVAVDAD